MSFSTLFRWLLCAGLLLTIGAAQAKSWWVVLAADGVDQDWAQIETNRQTYHWQGDWGTPHLTACQPPCSAREGGFIISTATSERGIGITVTEPQYAQSFPIFVRSDTKIGSVLTKSTVQGVEWTLDLRRDD